MLEGGAGGLDQSTSTTARPRTPCRARVPPTCWSLRVDGVLRIAPDARGGRRAGHAGLISASYPWPRPPRAVREPSPAGVVRAYLGGPRWVRSGERPVVIKCNAQ